MELIKSGRPERSYARIIVAALILITAAVSCILYQTTRYNKQGSQLSSYSLKLETRGFGVGVHEYNFVYSCLFSDNGSSCREQNVRHKIYWGLFAIVNLSADVTAGNYRGMRVKINGSKGKSFELKSVTLQGEQVFDGRDYSVFKNVKGIRISRDRKSGLVVFKLESDSASFDLDCSFNAPGVSGTAIRYTSALLFTVLFISAIFLVSLFGVSARIHRSGAGNREKGKKNMAECWQQPSG